MAQRASGGTSRHRSDKSVESSRALERPLPLRQAVYNAISEMIIKRDLEPGQHLIENELAAELDVSRQPVREALQRLQTEGWVDLTPGLGAFVHVPTESEADQLLAVRTLLETEAARLAAKHCTVEDATQLWQSQHAGEKALEEDNHERLIAANDELHHYIAKMSCNTILAEHIANIERRARWHYSSTARLRGKESWDEHATLIEAIENRSGRKAAELMRKHAEHTRTNTLAQYSESED